MSRSMLRWYPASWRDRYGAELDAMIEDSLEGEQPTMHFRWSIMRAGLSERLRGAGLIGDTAPPSGRIRGGAFTVLCGWLLFVIPGIVFAKLSEHWEAVTPRSSQHLPAISFNLVQVLAGLCVVAVLLGMTSVLPAFVRFVKDGGWPAIRRQVRWAAVATVAMVAVSVTIVIWAHHLPAHLRNGGSAPYKLLGVAWMLLFAATLFTWSTAAIAATRRLTLGTRQLKVAGSLAIAVALSMPIMTAAAAIWWGSIAAAAPWFFSGAPTGSPSSPWVASLLGALIVMTLASVVGVFGLVRVARSWRLLSAA